MFGGYPKFTHVGAYREPRTHSVDLYLSIDHPHESGTSHVREITMQTVQPGSVEEGGERPPLRLEEDAAQQLLDQLWAMGLRPTHAKSGDDLVESLTDSRDDARKTRDALLAVVLDRREP